MTRSYRVGLFVLPGALLCALLIALLCGESLRAQAPSGTPPQTWTEDDDQDPTAIDWSDDIPAHLSVVDGAAWIRRDGMEEAAGENVPLLSGDRLRTARGRVEIAFDDGSALDVDEATTLDLLSDSLVRLETGRLRLTLARGGASTEYRVDAAGTTVVLRPGGEYRVSVEGLSRTDPTVTVAVTHGSAEITSPYGRTVVRPGYGASASARSEPSPPYAVSGAAYDAFAQWADGLATDRAGAASARYLPAEVRSYGGLYDRYGDWQFDTSVGYVWYPRVDAAWRPYSTGQWSYVGAYGWFWIGTDRWSWPTHHYGRWGLSGVRWYWIPDRRWGPAWVSWAASREYVSWSPLGYNNRPLVSINFGFGYSSSPWRAWTAVPINRFGPAVVVNARSRALAVPVSTRFVERRSAPFRPTSARVDASPIRSPGSGGPNRYSATRQPSRSSPALTMASGSVTANRRPPTQMGAPTRSGAPSRASGRATAPTAASASPWGRTTPLTERAERSYPSSPSSGRGTPGASAGGRDIRSPQAIGASPSWQRPSAPNGGGGQRPAETPLRGTPSVTYGAPAPARTRPAPDAQSPRTSVNERNGPVDRGAPTGAEPRTRQAPAPRAEGPQAEQPRPASRPAPPASIGNGPKGRR